MNGVDVVVRLAPPEPRLPLSPRRSKVAVVLGEASERGFRAAVGQNLRDRAVELEPAAGADRGDPAAAELEHRIAATR